MCRTSCGVHSHSIWYLAHDPSAKHNDLLPFWRAVVQIREDLCLLKRLYVEVNCDIWWGFKGYSPRQNSGVYFSPYCTSCSLFLQNVLIQRSQQKATQKIYGVICTKLPCMSSTEWASINTRGTDGSLYFLGKRTKKGQGTILSSVLWSLSKLHYCRWPLCRKYNTAVHCGTNAKHPPGDKAFRKNSM